MKEKRKKWLCILTAAAVLLGGMQIPALGETQEISRQTESLQTAGESGVTVTTSKDFMAALEQGKSPITIDGVITIGEEAESSGRMKPVMIPANTLIKGTEGASLSSRGPIQLEGGGVRFQDLEMVFNSDDELGSIAHREIFLAGHSLTLDNVKTYLKGGVFGSEKELLPTVYAGGYTGTTVGGNASLTVQNSNNGTVFQAIYMGHGGGSDNNTPYEGSAVLNLDAGAAVREGIYADCNSQAQINISGKDGSYQAVAKAKEFCGNENTTLTLSRISVENAVADTVGNVILKEQARLSPGIGRLRNVTLQSGACLDFNALGDDAAITGDFTGVSNEGEERGILVLHPEKALIIRGAITGTTQFQTSDRLFPGRLQPDKTYIYADSSDALESGFVLEQSYIDRGYELKYNEMGWTVDGAVLNQWTIGHIELLSAPASVDLRKIAPGSLDENAYFEVAWYNKNGERFSDEEVVESGFYSTDYYVVLIQTDYWENDSEDEEITGATDWCQWVSLEPSEENSGRYYLQTLDGIEAFTGNYTVLFCSEPIEEYLVTVADVKALKDVVKAQCRVIFYNQDTDIPENSGHRHTFQEEITQEPTCTKEGEKTFTCSCGEKYTEKVAALGHREVIDPAVEPTETMEGKTKGSHCDRCGEVIRKQETIPATGKPEEHEHTYQGTVAKEPTCTQEGEKTFICSCGDQYTEKIAELGHHEVIDPAVDPTETEAGKTEGSHCDRCGEVIRKQETIPATGKPGEHEHTYQGTITKEPTCTEEGEKTFTCSCGEKYTEKIAALGHHKVIDPAVEPTETEEGKTEGSHCDRCGEVIRKQETIPATGKPGEHEHTYQGTVTKEPTCTEEGEKTYTCSCGDQYTEKIEALGHHYVEKRIPATTKSNGKVQKVCSVCAETTDTKVIEKPAKITWSKTDFIYDGKVKAPSVTVADTKGRKLAAGTDYRLVYSKGRKNPGVYTVTLEFRGNYSGRMTKDFTIRPGKTSLTKVTAKSRGIRVTWKKQTSQTDGYQIQYSTSGGFKGKAAKIISADKKVTAKNISRLKGKKKYYVRIRTYRTVKVNGKKKKLYSDWSRMRTIRTKK